MVRLTLATQLERVLAQPCCVPGAALGLGKLASLSKSSGGLASMGEAAEFTMFLHRLGDPVNFWVTTDSLVEGVDHDNLKILVG